MSLTTLTEEAVQAEVERPSEVEAQPPGTDVMIHAEIAGGTVTFSTPVFVEGVRVSGAVIIVTKPNASFNLQITLVTPGFTFQAGTPAILWATPPQHGYGANPFGTNPVYQTSPTMAVIPNSTGAKGSPALATQFALVLQVNANSNGLAPMTSVIVDPTIIDDPNT